MKEFMLRVNLISINLITHSTVVLKNWSLSEWIHNFFVGLRTVWVRVTIEASVTNCQLLTMIKGDVPTPTSKFSIFQKCFINKYNTTLKNNTISTDLNYLKISSLRHVCSKLDSGIQWVENLFLNFSLSDDNNK